MNIPDRAITTVPMSVERPTSNVFGVFEETDPLRRVLIWGPPGVEAYLAQLYPRDVSLFLDAMDVEMARQESHTFSKILEENGVEIIRARDLIAGQLPPSNLNRDDVLAQLIVRAREIHKTYPNEPDFDPSVIERLLDRDISRYGSEHAVALNMKLSLSEDLPLGNAIYACDQMKMVFGRRIQASFRYPIRQNEVELYEGLYSSLGLTDPITIPEGETFEGGDLYIHNGVVYIGVGSRTSLGAAIHIFKELRDELKAYAFKFAMVVDANSHERSMREQMDYMHLDTWSEPLDEKTMMLFPDEAFRRRVFLVESNEDRNVVVVDTEKNYIEFLETRGDTIFELSSEEQQSFGLNNLSLDPKSVVVSIDTNRRTLELLGRAGKKAIPLSLYQTTRGYGAAHCMTAQLQRVSQRFGLSNQPKA